MDSMAEDDRNRIGWVSGEDTEGEGNTIVGFEQMMMEIAHIHEKINRFTQLVVLLYLVFSWKDQLRGKVKCGESKISKEPEKYIKENSPICLGMV